jgi:3'-phosphoadenosine 5'-phosphosulfate sulfotransferase (PAPS reductase)/FAD synthetase
MKALRQAALLEQARAPAFLRKLEQSRVLIDQVLTRAEQEHQRWYVAFSGGSDSTVLLDLVIRHEKGQGIDVVWGDDGWDFPETLAFLEEIEQRIGRPIRRIRCLGPWRAWCQEMRRPELAEQPDLPGVWGNPSRWEATWHSLTRDARQAGYDGVFLGLLGTARRDGGESWTRWQVLHGGKRPLYQVQEEGGIWHCCPLAAWSKRDVWAYIVSRQLPYNRVYDRLTQMGIPLEQQRVAPLTCFRVLHYGGAVLFKQGWPSLWSTMTAIFPALTQYQ